MHICEQMSSVHASLHSSPCLYIQIYGVDRECGVHGSSHKHIYACAKRVMYDESLMVAWNNTTSHVLCIATNHIAFMLHGAEEGMKMEQ